MVLNRTEQVNGFSAFIDATTVYAKDKKENQERCRYCCVDNFQFFI